MINSVFGKTMENLRKRICGKLINNGKDYVKYLSRPSFVSQKMFSKNFVAVHRIKPLMYVFHYKYIKNKFDAKLLFTDTDSLVYEIQTEDVYVNFYLDKDLLDLSHYPLHAKFFDPVINKFIGKMKDEFKGKIISEFFGLKSKMYSLFSVDNEEVTKTKGVTKKQNIKNLLVFVV